MAETTDAGVPLPLTLGAGPLFMREEGIALGMVNGPDDLMAPFPCIDEDAEGWAFEKYFPVETLGGAAGEDEGTRMLGSGEAGGSGAPPP